MAIKSLQHSSITDNIFYRSMLAGNTAFIPEDEFLLEEQVLSSSAASVTFSGLDAYAGVYQHLQLRIVSRDTRVGNAGAATIRFNGDTGANYTGHYLAGNGSTVDYGFDGTGQTSSWAYYIPSANIAADSFGAAVIDLLDAFSTSKNMVFRSLSGFTSPSQILVKSGMRINTEALTSITLLASGGNYVIGSRFSLYGAK